MSSIKLKASEDQSEVISLSVEGDNEGPTFLTKVEAGKNEQRI